MSFAACTGQVRRWACLPASIPSGLLGHGGLRRSAILQGSGPGSDDMARQLTGMLCSCRRVRIRSTRRCWPSSRRCRRRVALPCLLHLPMPPPAMQLQMLSPSRSARPALPACSGALMCPRPMLAVLAMQQAVQSTRYSGLQGQASSLHQQHPIPSSLRP